MYCTMPRDPPTTITKITTIIILQRSPLSSPIPSYKDQHYHHRFDLHHHHQKHTIKLRSITPWCLAQCQGIFPPLSSPISPLLSSYKDHHYHHHTKITTIIIIQRSPIPSYKDHHYHRRFDHHYHQKHTIRLRSITPWCIAQCPGIHPPIPPRSPLSSSYKDHQYHHTKITTIIIIQRSPLSSSFWSSSSS